MRRNLILFKSFTQMSENFKFVSSTICYIQASCNNREKRKNHDFRAIHMSSPSPFPRKYASFCNFFLQPDLVKEDKSSLFLCRFQMKNQSHSYMILYTSFGLRRTGKSFSEKKYDFSFSHIFSHFPTSYHKQQFCKLPKRRAGMREILIRSLLVFARSKKVARITRKNQIISAVYPLFWSDECQCGANLWATEKEFFALKISIRSCFSSRKKRSWQCEKMINDFCENFSESK